MDKEQISVIINNKKLVKRIINKMYPFSNYIDVSKKTCFCPFHPNYNTPSAQVYLDEDGIYRLYCYSENKQYTAYDYIKYILEKNPVTLLYNISVSEEVIEHEVQRINNINNEEINEIKSIQDEQLSFSDYLSKIYSLK